MLRIYEGCNGIYIEHMPTGKVVCAGDGSETTLADLQDMGRVDPGGLMEAYFPEEWEEETRDMPNWWHYNQ